VRALWTLWLALMTVVAGETPDVGLGTPALGVPSTSTTEIDARVKALTTRLRCPVCQGLNVAESRSEAARAMKARIRELVAQGYTQEQVVEYFTDRYGDWVLLEPPRTGVNWLLWTGPFGLLLVGGAWLVFRYRGGSPRLEAPRGTGAGEESSDEDPYVARLLAELEERP
jgi:cytochrome c-type biogenesis protein CcmH